MEAMLLHDRALKEIEEIGERRKPAEACGILLPTPWGGRWVVEVPNRSMVAQSNFLFSAEDVKMVLAPWFATLNEDLPPNSLTIWHTHPGGGIGPSRTDMQHKVDGARMLVVALTDDGPVPSWY